MNAIVFLALWLQMSASTTGISHLGSVTVDHGKVVSTQIACIKTYEDGAIEYNPCEISTPPTDNFVKPAVQYNEFDLAAQRAADETDGKQVKPGATYQVDPSKPFPSDHNEFPEVKMCGGDPPHPCNEPPVERVDVPAVQETREVNGTGCTSNTYLADGTAICELAKISENVMTCADKSRILEHDENSPAKYWCRKVQP